MSRAALMSLTCLVALGPASAFADDRAKKKELNEKVKRFEKEFAYVSDDEESAALAAIREIVAFDTELAARWLTGYATERSYEWNDLAGEEIAGFKGAEALGWLSETLAPKKGKAKKKTLPKRILLARVLRGRQEPVFVQALGRVLSGKKTPHVLLCESLRAVGELPDDALLEGLIAKLKEFEKESGHSYWLAREALTRATGHDLGTHEAWSGWWAKQARPWDPKARGEAKEASTTAAGSPHVASMFGVPLRTRGVTFAIDASASMNEDNRWGHAVKELRQVLAGLPKETRFNVIAYGSGIRSWQKRAVPAKMKAKRAASAWLSEIKPREIEDETRRMLELAVQDPSIDTVCIVSDGRSSRGGGFVIQQRRVRELRVHVFAYDHDAEKEIGPYSPVRMAKLSGGTFVPLPRPEVVRT